MKHRDCNQKMKGLLFSGTAASALLSVFLNAVEKQSSFSSTVLLALGVNFLQMRVNTALIALSCKNQLRSLFSQVADTNTVFLPTTHHCPKERHL